MKTIEELHSLLKISSMGLTDGVLHDAITELGVVRDKLERAKKGLISIPAMSSHFSVCQVAKETLKDLEEA